MRPPASRPRFATRWRSRRSPPTAPTPTRKDDCAARWSGTACGNSGAVSRRASPSFARRFLSCFLAKRDGHHGGSVSRRIGFVWLAPSSDWTAQECGERLWHEYLHHALFLEDMVNTVFVRDPCAMSEPENRVPSAVRGVARRYDQSLSFRLGRFWTNRIQSASIRHRWREGRLSETLAMPRCAGGKARSPHRQWRSTGPPDRRRFLPGRETRRSGPARSDASLTAACALPRKPDRQPPSRTNHMDGGPRSELHSGVAATPPTQPDRISFKEPLCVLDCGYILAFRTVHLKGPRAMLTFTLSGTGRALAVLVIVASLTSGAPASDLAEVYQCPCKWAIQSVVRGGNVEASTVVCVRTNEKPTLVDLYRWPEPQVYGMVDGKSAPAADKFRIKELQSQFPAISRYYQEHVCAPVGKIK